VIDHLEGEACDPVLDAEQGLIIIESFTKITIQKSDSASSFCIGPYIWARTKLCVRQYFRLYVLLCSRLRIKLHPSLVPILHLHRSRLQVSHELQTCSRVHKLGSPLHFLSTLSQAQ